MVGHQITASSQLAGPNDLVALTSHELEEAVKLVVEECAKLRREETVAPKRAKGLEAGPSQTPPRSRGRPLCTRLAPRSPLVGVRWCPRRTRPQELSSQE
ncbi:hypothetical protein PanWU01x14_325190 [Parasponia andersonii]|uniref:Uncharacterized protein n=1 Tax=Parasponia andersonii TaxID=3476 RepID=A0A2P5AJX5_PARAD|nr:hypothetical protein PanWU01x14_325190 [Parasponia andersonii]